MEQNNKVVDDAEFKVLDAVQAMMDTADPAARKRLTETLDAYCERRGWDKGRRAQSLLIGLITTLDGHSA